MLFFKRLFATKSLEQLHHEMGQDEGRLRRILGPIGLTSLGIGAIIGAGIFVITGRVAAEDAGPAIMLSYAIAGLGCALAAFCYAEFAALAPVAGSAYTYAYATLGELLAWIIGWDLVLEYAMSCATVASAWSEYFNYFLKACFDFQLPDAISNDPFTKPGAWFNLPAVGILLVVTAVLVIGIRESAISNTILVVIKLSVVLFVIASLASTTRELAVGEEKHICEVDCHLAYSVASVKTAREWAGKAAHGQFYIVTVRVRFDSNTIAKWRPRDLPLYPNGRSVALVDGRGQRHPAPPDALNRKLLPGQEYTTDFVFDVPADSSQPPPRLELESGDWPTHFMIAHENAFLHGKLLFRLAA